MVLAPAGIAAVLALWNLNFGLPYLYRPDEDTVVGRAVRMAAEHTIDPVYPNWLPLGFYVFTLAEWLGSLFGAGNLHSATAGDPSAAYLIGRSVSALAQTATTAFVFWGARRAYNVAAAGLAGSLMAVAPLAVRQAHFATVDGLLAMLVSATAAASLAARNSRGFALAGLLAGLAAGVKYNGALAFLLPAVMALQGDERIRRLATAAVAAAAGFAVTLPALVLRPGSYLNTAAFLGRDLYAHQSPEPVGWIFDPAVVLPLGLGFGACALAFAGIAVAARRRSRADLALLAFAVAYLVVLGSGHENFFRYVLPVMPVLAVLAGAWITSFRGRALPAALAAAGILLAPSLYASVATDRLLGAVDTRTRAAGWILDHVPAGATISVAYYASPFYDSDMVSNQGRYIAGDRLAASFLQGRYTSRYVVTDQPAPGAVLVRSSGPPWQAPQPAAAGAAFASSPWTAGANTGSVYDPLDSFYLPIWGFDGLQRMGPAIVIVPAGR